MPELESDTLQRPHERDHDQDQDQDRIPAGPPTAATPVSDGTAAPAATGCTDTDTDSDTETEPGPETIGDDSPGEQSHDTTTTAIQTCPECDGSLVTDTEHAETVCRACGLVVDDDQIDHGPEWRAFDDAERDEKRRVGAPVTETLHDKGLSTTIGWRDQDATGNALPPKKRRRLQRQRTWNERFRTRDHKERGVKQMLSEVQRMSAALDLPESVHETASVICRRASEADLLPGRSIEGVATAAVYAALRRAGLPRRLDAVVAVSRLGKLRVTRTYRTMVTDLGLRVPPPEPHDYLPQVADALDLSDEGRRRARAILDIGIEAELHTGKNPAGVTAAACYAAGRFISDDLTQEEAATAASVSTVTIRNRYQELLNAYDDAGAPMDEPDISSTSDR